MPEKTKVALWVRLEAKPGKEQAVADFIRSIAMEELHKLRGNRRNVLDNPFR